jgi:hypothetical protein
MVSPGGSERERIGAQDLEELIASPADEVPETGLLG